MDTNEAVVPQGTDLLPDKFNTKEYWLILYLLAMDFPILEVECRVDRNGQNFLMWFFPLEFNGLKALEIERDYSLKRPLVANLHKLREASETFKLQLQYYHIK